MEIFYRTQLENDIILADDIVPEAMPAANSRGERARDRMLLLLSKAANSNAMDFSEMASDYCISHCKPFIASTILPEEVECMKICHSKFINARRIIAKQIMNTVGFNAYLMRSAITKEKQFIQDDKDKYPFEQYEMGRRQRDPKFLNEQVQNGPDESLMAPESNDSMHLAQIRDGFGRFSTNL
jgi:hypothetical protein